MGQDVMQWLTEVRKLDAALLADMGVKAQDHPQLGAVAAFAYHRSGKPYAGKFRAVEGKDWRSTHGVSRGLYNEDALRSGSGPVVLTEGEIDALSVMQAGYLRAVSLPDGWTEDGGKRDVLVEAEAALRQSPFVIVAGDNDAAGSSLPKTVANILAGHDVRYAEWPEGCKDANDVLCQFGEGELARCLVDAKRVDPEGGFITGISDLPPMPARRVLRVGMEPYDFALAFEVGAMSVGTGTPGSGKSTFTTFAAFHVAKAESVKVGFLAFETHPFRIRDHLARLQTGKPWDRLSADEQARCAHFLDEHFRIVHRTFDGNKAHNLGWLEDMIYTLAVRDGCKLIIVDPWNELEHLPEPGESMTAYVNFALQSIRQWAEQFDTHICLIAHPRKMPTDGKPRPPTGYDIADSAAFFNKPSLGFTVHQDANDEGEEFVRITTWKVRDTELYGFEKGEIRLCFYTERMGYEQFKSAARYRSSK
jgi:twinkle protein